MKKLLPEFKEIRPTEIMVEKAKDLRTGKILIVYLDHHAIRMETARGKDPYVWRHRLQKWVPMRLW